MSHPSNLHAREFARRVWAWPPWRDYTWFKVRGRSLDGCLNSQLMSSPGLNGGSLTHMRASEAAVSPVADVIHRLGSDSSMGLQCMEAERRQQTYGLNEFDIREEDPLWRKYLNQVSVLNLAPVPCSV